MKKSGLSKSKKALLIILSILIIIIAVMGTAYAASPRDFLQLILGEKGYTEFVISKNIKDKSSEMADINEAFSKKIAFNTNGKVNFNFSDGAILNNKVTSEAEKYLSSLNIESQIYRDSKRIKMDTSLNDADGRVLSAEVLTDLSSTYLNIPQFNTGYIKLNKNKTAGKGNKEAEKSKNILNKIYKSSDIRMSEAVRMSKQILERISDSLDNGRMEILSKKALNVSNIVFTGDVIKIYLPSEELKSCINDIFAIVENDEEFFNSLNDTLPQDERISYE